MQPLTRPATALPHPTPLQEWLSQVEVPASLKAFVLQGTAPGAARATLAAVGLTSAP